MHMKVQAAAKKNQFAPQEFRSDALAALRAYNTWAEIQQRDYVAANRFCVDNFLSKPTLLLIQKTRRHLLQSLHYSGAIAVSGGGNLSASRIGKDLQVPPELNANGESLPLLAALIAIACQPKFAIRTSEKTYRTSRDKVDFVLHELGL
jgi:small subunit ribosomal protein S24e